MHVRLEQLVTNPDNPRLNLGSLVELAASIAELGLLQPLLVVHVDDVIGACEFPGERYMVVDGHRRYAAMRTIDYALPIPVVITDMDRTARLIAAVSAGAYTKRLDPIERARAFRQLQDELGLTLTEIAKRCGCSTPAVSSALRLLELDGTTQTKVSTGALSATAAIAQARAIKRHPQGRKPTVRNLPDPAAHPVDLTLCLTVRGSTDHTKLGTDLGRWFEDQHTAGKIPHATHIISVDDWSAR